MLPEALFTALLVVGLVAALIGSAVFRAADTGKYRQALGLLAVIVGFSLVGLERCGGTRVYVVTPTASGLDASKSRIFSQAGYPLHGTATLLKPSANGSLVINDSPQPLRLVRHEYGKSLFGAFSPGPDVIPPYSLKEGPEQIDYLGPADQPPDTISVQKGSSWEVRYHLTW